MLGVNTMNRWIVSASVLAILLSINGYMIAEEEAADAAYLKQVAAQKQASKDKLIYDLAKRGEYMTGFAMVQK